VIDAVRASKDSAADHGLAYFYADFAEIRTRQPKHVLRSLLAQLIANRPSLIQTDLDDLVKQMNDNRDPPSDVLELADLIVKTCVHYGDVTLVLDALDECVDRDEFLPCFEVLRASVSGNISVFVTSRKERDIRDVFKDLSTIALEGEGKHVLVDMEKHIRKELESNRGYSKIPPRMKDVIITSLLEGADGMYVAASFTLCLYAFTDSA
jgi:hypothetical protein